MGVLTASDKYTSPIPPARMFKALIIAYPNLITKLIPQIVVTADVHPPEGGVNIIRQTSYTGGTEQGLVKNQVEELNEETLTYKCTMIEGGPLPEGKIETFVYEAKISPAAARRSISWTTSTYYTVGDAKLSEEKIRNGSEKSLRMYKLMEAYLIQDPEAYS